MERVLNLIFLQILWNGMDADREVAHVDVVDLPFKEVVKDMPKLLLVEGSSIVQEIKEGIMDAGRVEVLNDGVLRRPPDPPKGTRLIRAFEAIKENLGFMANGTRDVLGANSALNLGEEASKGFHIVTKDFIKRYCVSFLVLLETRISGIQADKSISKLGFDFSYRVEARRSSSGI
ncbi:hypothetical protein GH714_017886 [Hevea brasiliensis]|uniref:Uncharacterized protein n=1 Tax=Hevea brasiliensis TaxID=3981 RepID=A0A6A6NI34_HEVBR|nr:hypothetical protein GH714_017886 [Hevea brasiliensis]